MKLLLAIALLVAGGCGGGEPKPTTDTSPASKMFDKTKSISAPPGAKKEATAG